MAYLQKKETQALETLIKKTGKIILTEFKSGNNLKAKFKSKHEIVTKTDYLAEKIILTELKKLTPAWRIISEEKGDNKKKSDYTWLVDPLDGTTNFYMGNPLFAVQIALLYKNEPVLAFIYAPAIDEYYFAQKNQGASLNNKKIKVSQTKLDKAILTYCHGNQEKHLKKALKIYQHFKLKHFDIRQLGCAALEFAWVAKGKTDCYISPGANPWDIAAGALLVKEAGGKIYNFKGETWTLSSKTIFASNGVIDKKLLKYLKTL